MEALVFDVVGVLPEALPAVGAAAGPLLCVYEMVQEERGTPQNTYSASAQCGSFGGRSGWHGAWSTAHTPCTRRAVFSMDLLVLIQVRAAAEALPTLPTFMGSLPSVGSLVSIQVGSAGEALPTLLTLVRPLPSVDAPVFGEFGVSPEFLPTVKTLVGPLLSVCLVVLDE